MLRSINLPDGLRNSAGSSVTARLSCELDRAHTECSGAGQSKFLGVAYRENPKKGGQSRLSGSPGQAIPAWQVLAGLSYPRRHSSALEITVAAMGIAAARSLLPVLYARNNPNSCERPQKTRRPRRQPPEPEIPELSVRPGRGVPQPNQIEKIAIP